MNNYALLVLALVLASPVVAQDRLPSLSDLENGWNAISTSGQCSGGTPYRFYANPSSASDNLLIYFNGGGACWFGEACDLNSEPNVHTPSVDVWNDPSSLHGIFAEDIPENPFREYDMVFIPYCTGDVHLGAGERQYRYVNAEGADVEFLVHHDGFANSMTILDWVYATFDSPQRVVIAGSSAGAIGASFYAGLVAERYASVPVVLIGDAAGGYNSPFLPNTFKAWNTAAILPDWPHYNGKTNDNLTFEDFYIASANHSPNLTIAQYNAAEDGTQYDFSYLIGDAPGSFSVAQRLLNHYVEIESAVDAFYSYTAGGATHMILNSRRLYSYEVEGVRFVDWLDDLINGRPVADVSCVNEIAGCAEAPD